MPRIKAVTLNTGDRFGFLVVIAATGEYYQSPNSRGKTPLIECHCDCGKVVVITRNHLLSGHTKSCGNNLHKRKHGMAKTPIYRLWNQMRNRCENPNDPGYEGYGGRGITVCGRWDSFENFFADMGKRPSSDYSIERKDNDKGYSPDNCKWATRKEQNRNTRKNLWIQFNGNNKTLAEWSEITGLCDETIRCRLKNGWSVERALTTKSARDHSRSASLANRIAFD